MAQPTVRIHPPKRGDEEWLASMIAPLLDMSSDLLAQGFAMGPISVGESLDADEADDLVDVLKGFGAQAERIGAQSSPSSGQRRAPVAPAPPAPSQTQPFDGGHLRRMLAATPPPPRPSGARAQTQVKPPARRSAPVRTPARRDSSPVASPSARPSAGPPPRVSRSSDASPATIAGAPLASARGAASAGPAAGSPGGPSVPPNQTPAPRAQVTTGPVLAGRPHRASGPVSAPGLAKDPSRSQPSAPPAKPRTLAAGRPARSSKGPASLTTPDRPSGDVPPWFPQVPMRPGADEPARQARDRSWIWFVLIMAVAGATAWYLQTRID